MTPPGPPPEVLAHYGEGLEHRRHLAGPGRLEFVRTREVLRRYLPPPPAAVLDVGGGAGAHAAWLAADGHRVHLVDPVALHVDQARATAEAGGRAAFTVASGDARCLEEPDATCDAVLLLGPLYHLTERAERLAALREAGRVVRPGGVVAAAAISRFASLLSGLRDGFAVDPAFARIVEQDLADGQHRNPENRPGWFTTAFFHHPDELAQEVQEAGLVLEAVVGLEGAGWLFADLDERWADPARREAVLAAARATEAEPSLAGLSAHLLAVAKRAVPRRRPSGPAPS